MNGTIKVMKQSTFHQTTYHLCWPDEARLKARGFGRVAHVPFIFDGNWSYHRLSSDYLTERALLDWSPGGGAGFGSKRLLTEISLRGIGESLCNFLEWVERRNLDWRQLEYQEHIVEGYQAEMRHGSWSVRGKSLSPATVNRRVQEACNYLIWASAKCHRSKVFTVVMNMREIKANTAKNSHGHRKITIESRVGKVRPSVNDLRLPRDSEISRWLSCVKIEKGQTKSLMCELILNTGIRRAEAAAWRIDTLPLNREDWNIIGSDVSVNIKFGTKGPSYGKDHEDKIGPERTISISLNFAERLAHYLEFSRPRARKKWVNSAATLEEKRSRLSTSTPHLFLSEYDGTRITDKTLYDAWTRVSWVPYVGWSPHLGRHFWACKTLLNLAQKRSEELKERPRLVPIDWTMGNASFDIILIIQPQLGHIDKATTESYLRWLRRIIGFDFHEEYGAHLDSIRDFQLNL
ncbi:MAG: site-specific integrase [Acidovorax sp.]